MRQLEWEAFERELRRVTFPCFGRPKILHALDLTPIAVNLHVNAKLLPLRPGRATFEATL